MATSYNRYTATGSTQLVVVPEYISQDHIIVKINDVATVAYTWVNAQTISLTAAAGSIIEVRRLTSPAARLVDYIDGVPLTELALDTDSKQAFFRSQEAQDTVDSSLSKDYTGHYQAGGSLIRGVAPGVGVTDAVNKTQLDAYNGALELNVIATLGYSTDAALSEFEAKEAERRVNAALLTTNTAAGLTAALGASTGAGLVGFTQAGTGAAPRTVQSRQRDVVSLLDFYANGVSGVAVDPTGVVDSTLGIQAFFDAPIANKVIPTGTYKHSGTLRIQKAESIHSANAVFKFTGSGVNALEIKPVSGLINKLHIDGHLTLSRATINYTDNFAGLFCEALYSSEIHISVEFFARGMHFNGRGDAGVVYNKFFIGELANCKYSQFFTSAPGGWVNKNDFHGGRYYGGTAGMLNHIEMDTAYLYNGNKWLFPSLEGIVNGHIFFNLLGAYNEILIGYAEHSKTDGLSWAICAGTNNSIYSTAPYMASAGYNDPAERLNITGTFCAFYGIANQLRSHQGGSVSVFKTASPTKPVARYECSSGAGITALDVVNTSNGSLNAFRILNADDSVGVTLTASGRAWKVKGNTTGTINKSVLWTETVAPSTGTWSRGDIAWANAPSAGGSAGWICTTAGTPGTWSAFGPIQSTAAYTVTNGSADRALNVTTDTVAQVAAVLGTLIADLQGSGVIS